MRRVASTVITSIAASALLAGCPNREVSKVEIIQSPQERREIPVEVNRGVDILFVIDNSDSMGEEQASLIANFDRFISVLEQIEGGLPDVHLGVISTDMGADGRIIGCDDDGGDNGALQYAPGENCQLPEGFLEGTFISDVATADGTSRQRNYQGSLTEAFSCIAELGTGGCGFEAPLESMRQALTNNSDFLRPDAFLAVIFIADEDDCSTFDPLMFDPEDTSLEGPLGPLDSFRCFEFGVECELDQPRDLGAKAECVPRENSQYMYGVQEYIDFIKGLKEDDYQIIVGGIIGNADPVVVNTKTGRDGETRLTLEPSCISDSGEAAPGVRLDSFLKAFRDRNTVTTICNEDLSEALTLIAQLLAKVIGNPCLEPKIDLEPEADGIQHDCQVSDVRYIGPEIVSEDPLKQCSSNTPSADEYPCWYLDANTESCSNAEQPIELVIERGENVPPAGTKAIISCVTR